MAETHRCAIQEIQRNTLDRAPCARTLCSDGCMMWGKDASATARTSKARSWRRVRHVVGLLVHHTTDGDATDFKCDENEGVRPTPFQFIFKVCRNHSSICVCILCGRNPNKSGIVIKQNRDKQKTSGVHGLRAHLLSLDISFSKSPTGLLPCDVFRQVDPRKPIECAVHWLSTHPATVTATLTRNN